MAAPPDAPPAPDAPRTPDAPPAPDAPRTPDARPAPDAPRTPDARPAPDAQPVPDAPRAPDARPAPDAPRGLDLTLRLADPDAAFALLVEAHTGLSPAEAEAVTARLLLILVNQLGDETLLRQAIQLARRPFAHGAPAPPAPAPPAPAPPAARAVPVPASPSLPPSQSPEQTRHE